MIVFSMLVINNNRSKAYLQNFINSGFIPSEVVYLENNLHRPENKSSDFYQDSEENFVYSKTVDIGFDENEQVLTTLVNNNIPYTVVNTIDINSSQMIEAVRNLSSNYIVYSGPGGSILRKEILSLGKKFIHSHPGFLPDFRGSTTIYYSLLINNRVGVSVIFFELELDSGPILYKKEFNMIDVNIDFDYVLDPCIRTKSLIEFFNTIRLKDKIETKNLDYQNKQDGDIFYIIHPVLKTMAINKFKDKK